MPAFYRELDVFGLPSVSTEGLPLVVLEAIASRRPVIATTVGGTPEVVREGVDGSLVPPADAAKLAQAMAKLARDAKLRRAMGESGRERVARDFSMERVAREVANVYTRVMAGAQGRSRACNA
jgi:glycosyltransferase involved in cell wall biosynthesis